MIWSNTGVGNLVPCAQMNFGKFPFLLQFPTIPEYLSRGFEVLLCLLGGLGEIQQVMKWAEISTRNFTYTCGSLLGPHP